MMKCEQRVLVVCGIGALLVSLFAGCSAEAKKTRYLKRADRYFRSGEYEKAKIEYLKVLRLGGQHPQAIRNLGVIHYEQGAMLQAASLLRQAVATAPQDLDVKLKLAQASLSVGDVTNARAQVLAILDRSPTNDEAVVILVDSSRTTNEIGEAQQRLQKLQRSLGPRSAFHLAAAGVLLRQRDAKSAEEEVRKALAMDPKSPAAHVAMARFHLTHTNLADAEKEFKAAAELAPVRSATRLAYPEFKLQTRAVDEARNLLNDLTRQAPDYTPALGLLARLAFAQTNYADAIKLIDKVLAIDQANLSSRMLLVQIRLAQHEAAKAVTEAVTLTKLFPKLPEGHYLLARAHLQGTNLSAAAAALTLATTLAPQYVEALLLQGEINLARGDPGPVVSSMQTLLGKQPGVWPAHLLLAQAYRRLNRLDEAAAVYQGLSKASPKNPEPLFQLGLVQRQQNKNTEARQTFEKAQALNPENPMVLAQLVDLDILEKKFEPALARVQARLQKDPKSAAARFLEGRIRMAQSDWDKAEAALLQSLELDPNFSSAYYALAGVYMTANKLPQSVGQLEARLARNPRDQRALMLSAMIYEKMKDYPKARQAYEKSLEVNPQFVLALNNLAVIYSEHLGDLNQAYELACKARTLVPDEPSIADTLGWILYQRGEHQLALAPIREAAEKMTANPEIQFHLGMTHYMLGQEEPARIALRKAVQSTEVFRGQDEARARLALLENDLSRLGANAIPALEKMAKGSPPDLIAKLRLAEAYERQEDRAKAARLYEEVFALHPRHLLAALKLAQLNPGRAMEMARKARESAPADSQVAHVAGRVACEARDYELAQKLLQSSALNQPENADVLYDLGWATYCLSRVEEAEQSVQRALQAQPEFPRAKAAQAFLEMTALSRNPPQLLQKEARVQEMLRAEPNHLPALMALAAIQTRRGDARAGAQTYEKILVRWPQFLPAQKRLAAVYADDPAQEKRAFDLAFAVWKALPEDAEAMKIYGKVSCQRKDYRYAAVLLERSLLDNPADTEALYYLGLAQYQIQDFSNSKDSLQRVLAAAPNAPFAAEARRMLAELQKR